MSTLDVDIQRADDVSSSPSDAELTHWAQAGYQGRSDEPVEVTVRLVSEAESAELNYRYRKKDRPTNVLSFPFEAPPGIPLPLLGDLVICTAVVVREAADQRKKLSAHWAHMVIHGMLHLQGFDHINPRDAERMEALETRLIQSLGYPAPYPDEEAEQHS